MTNTSSSVHALSMSVRDLDSALCMLTLTRQTAHHHRQTSACLTVDNVPWPSTVTFISVSRWCAVALNSSWLLSTTSQPHRRHVTASHHTHTHITSHVNQLTARPITCFCWSRWHYIYFIIDSVSMKAKTFILPVTSGHYYLVCSLFVAVLAMVVPAAIYW